MRNALLVPVLFISTLHSAGVAAQETLAPGFVYYVESGYYVVEADLSSDSVEVRVNLTSGSATQDAETVQQHAMDEGATIAINANAFGTFGALMDVPCGAARGFGVNFSDAFGDAQNCASSLGWARTLGATFDSAGHETDQNFFPQCTEIATGAGYLLQNGQPVDWNHNKLFDGDSCTAIGISADRKRFVFVVTDIGACSGAGLQDALTRHGAADAIQLDEDGSSKMWISGTGYVNNEQEDLTPPNIIFARPNGTCPSDCGAARCIQLLRPFRAECEGQACRAGLDDIWNCDEPLLRRAHCVNGLVVYEYCAMGCQMMADGMDDTCLGGAIPEPVPDMAMAIPDLAATPDLITVKAGDPDAAGGGQGASIDGGCGCRITSRTPLRTGTLLLPLGLLFALRRRRESAR